MHRAFIMFVAGVTCVQGQWLRQRATRDLDLSAPTPKTLDGKPDLTGVWQVEAGAHFFDIAKDLQPGDVLPWTEKVFRDRSEDLGKDRWTITCLPGGPALGLDRQIEKIVQTPDVLMILYEDLTYRQIFLDGRELPVDPNPTWMGYSAGRWDGDTLMVESAGFNDRTWLDYGGHPHTESLHITERYRRRDAGHLEVDTTYSDAKAYAKPWTIRTNLTVLPDTELIEYVCAENEKDQAHLVGKASDETKNAVSIAPEVLAKYAGTYELHPAPGVAVPMVVELAGTQLFVNFPGRTALTPISETTFSSVGGGRIQFVMDDAGMVTHLVLSIVEGDLTAMRKY